MKDHQIAQKLIAANPVPHPEHLHDDSSEAGDLFALILERRDAMTITKQPAPTRDTVGLRRRRRPALVAAAAALFVLVAVGVAALIGFSGDELDSADQPTSLPAVESTQPPVTDTTPPTSIVPPVVTTLPAQPATLLDGTWKHETSTEPFAPFDAVRTSLGLIATGTTDGIWLSPDGISWTQVLAFPQGEMIEDASLLPGEPPLYTIESRVGSVIEFDGAVYVFGFTFERAASTNRRVVYRSADGVTWDETTYAGDYGGETVVAGENEIVVILAGSDNAIIMRSEDGLTWTRHETGSATGLGFRVAAFFDGEYLAVHEDPESAGYEWGKRMIARSSDGIEWDLVPGSEFPYNAFPRDMTVFDDRLYMGGHFLDESVDVAQQGTIFVSEDGTTWELATLPEIANLRFVTDLIPSQHGLLALGGAFWSEDEGIPDRLVPMTTIDGTTFVEIPDPDGVLNVAEWPSGYAAGDRIVIHDIERTREEGGEAVFHEWIWNPAG